MRAKKWIFVCAAVLIFVGCAPSNGEINESFIKEQAIVSTQKIRAELADKSTLLLTATYMNNMQKYASQKYDIVVLGAYYSPSNASDKKEFAEPKIEANGKIISIEKIAPENALLQSVPSANIWSKYYKVELEKTNFKELILSVEIYPFSKVLLNLPKEP